MMGVHETFPLDEHDKALIKGILIILTMIALMLALVAFSGCLGINSTDDAKKAALDAISPVVVMKGSTQYEKIMAEQNPPAPIPTTLIPIATTIPTPIPAPTIAAHTVDPYSQGERWEKQWFKNRGMRQTNPLFNESIRKPLDFGIVVYDHKFVNGYTWWSDIDGQYYKMFPKPGYKFLFVWVHEEVFGDSKTNIVLMPGFSAKSFVAQYKQALYYNDTSYDPVNTILEFDAKPDYYKISRTSALGYIRIYIGFKKGERGGWIAENQEDLYTGQGNAWDGYIVYQVPASATDHDTLVVGNFGGYGNAYWRFDIYDSI
jgi:hypothetical protein